jgi:hypothetical protein
VTILQRERLSAYADFVPRQFSRRGYPFGANSFSDFKGVTCSSPANRPY